MKVAVISDIHANLEALEAVSRAISESGAEAIYFAGDVVGYGPDPNECTRWVMENADLAVVGNHDHAAAGLMDAEAFNRNAREAIVWTWSRLEPWAVDYIRCLPYVQSDGNITLAHSSPKGPENWDYIFTLWDAEMNFAHFEGSLCFVGHSHQPVCVGMDPQGTVSVIPGEAFTVREGWRYLVNVGSVGQPRDGNPDACVAFFDSESSRFNLVRIPYDVGKTQGKMIRSGLPRALAERLAGGR